MPSVGAAESVTFASYATSIVTTAGKSSGSPVGIPFGKLQSTRIGRHCVFVARNS